MDATQAAPTPHAGATLPQLAHQLARDHRRLAIGGRRGAGGAPRTHARHVRDLRAQLEAAYAGFARPGGDRPALEGAREWLLDNEYLVLEVLQQLSSNLPPGFQRRLALVEPPGGGRPRERILETASSLAAFETHELDPLRMAEFLQAYQQVQPLDMAELWAFPAMLQLAVLEHLARAAGTALRLAEHQDSGVEGGRYEREVAAAITSLRTLQRIRWSAFFEQVSRVHAVLGVDPEGVYGSMTFETRDAYRKAVERIALRAGRSELEVAEASIALAREGADAHVGVWLVGAGRDLLEARVGVPTWRLRVRGWLRRHAPLLYLGALASVTVLVLGATLTGVGAVGATWTQLAVVALLGSFPASALATAVVHWIAAHVVPPRILPRIDLESGIPDEARTLVVLPVLVHSVPQVEALLGQLERAYLANLDDNLLFALLTDLPDAPARRLRGEDAVTHAARAGTDELNARYGDVRRPERFLLLHRERRWNDAEGCWMGWERKRGKLEELNRLLRGDPTTSYQCEKTDDISNRDLLETVTFVITLDADTQLPPGTAASLVGTLLHPLNRARVGPDREVLQGYTVVQPRVHVRPEVAARTPFTRIFSGDTHVDLYSRAVSDVYQDLFGEGTFVGKGIYEVDSFDACLHDRIPENTILSHDLIEGLLGRAALATDIVLYEDYPPDTVSYMRRLHRWVRGDWQLLPWLGRRVPSRSSVPAPSPLTALDRWKIIDNLRRSLLPASYVLLLAAGWLWLPGGALAWTLGLLAILGSPFLLGATEPLVRIMREGSGRGWRETLGSDLARWACAAVLLPYEAAVTLDAIVRTLVRLWVTRRRLLEWVTAAQASGSRSAERTRLTPWREMWPGPALALALLTLILGFAPGALAVSWPLLALWLVSPLVAERLSRPDQDRTPPLDPGSRRVLRRLARRTFSFFERFASPDDSWLPVDNYQVHPPRGVAHRTSPTNIGFGLAANLAAWDLGYLPLVDLVERTRNQLGALSGLERHRGHLLNWYDTHDRSPLEPRYVSTVDSGNLAACMMVLEVGLGDAARRPLLEATQVTGLLDTAEVLAEESERTSDAVLIGLTSDLCTRIRTLEDRGSGVDLTATLDLLQAAEGVLVSEMERRLVELIGPGSRPRADRAAPVLAALDSTLAWLRALRQQVRELRRTAEVFLPWAVSPPPAPPALASELEEVPALEALPGWCESRIAQLDSLMAGATIPQWAGTLRDQLESSGSVAKQVLDHIDDLRSRLRHACEEMDFSFLYDPDRQLFRIGYNISASEPDPHYYDLLASEARLASMVAIAWHAAPPSHWLHLGRPVLPAGGRLVLASWGGTLFEYAMPGLFLRSPRGTLLDMSCRAAVRHQITFGRSHSIPWGVSESGFYAFDGSGNYQYRAFGVPGLGFKRDLTEDLVVAPYASLLALPYEPGAVMENLAELRRRGMVGDCGLYEAMDFTPGRADGAEGATVCSYMVHHQGMILLALDNAILDRVLVERFHSDPRVAAVEHLLHEQNTMATPGETPPPRRVAAPTATLPVDASPWRMPTDSRHPHVHLLTNGRMTTLFVDRGGGQLRWQGYDLTRWDADPTAPSTGIHLHLRDVQTGELFHEGPIPDGGPVEDREILLTPARVDVHRRWRDLRLHLQIAIAVEADVETRRVRLVNERPVPRRLFVSSYAEVVLAPHEEERRHPAFNGLFLECETVGEGSGTLLYSRRPRCTEEAPLCLGHRVLVAGRVPGHALHESDRGRFLGRGGSPVAPRALAGDDIDYASCAGTPLDPVLALGVEVELPAHGEAEVTWLTSVAESREGALLALERTSSRAHVDWVFEHARLRAGSELRRVGVPGDEVRLNQLLLSAVLSAPRALRAPAVPPADPALGPRALWARGISGRFPILVVRVAAESGLQLVRRIVRAHALWHGARENIDLVVLDDQPGGYLRPLESWLARELRRLGAATPAAGRGGVFLVRADQLRAEERASLLEAARVVLEAEGDGTAGVVAGPREPPAELPDFVPLPGPSAGPIAGMEPLRAPDGLLLSGCGLGGFTADGAEFVMHLEDGLLPPAPWINVLANPHAGCLVSESGLGATWVGNSALSRLSPWHNDAVSPPPAEAIYLRDEETGHVWSPTPSPAPDGAAYQVRHGAERTVFRHHSQGLEQELIVTVPADGPLKVARLRLRNRCPWVRRITATYYVEWVLGERREATWSHLRTSFDAATGTLLARNPFGEDALGGVAFLTSDHPPHGVTCDRTEFLGREGDRSRPAALTRVGLSGNVTACRDPCAALMVHMDIPEGSLVEVTFALGMGEDSGETGRLVGEVQQPGWSGRVQAASDERWDRILGAVQVRTPDPALDVFLNRWLLHQTLSCRLWGRTALYQSGGAFGFRDQLQDVLALLWAEPGLAREHILECARHQFVEGDVLHWWHPPAGQGVRTRCSDDLLWLPYVTACYVEATGDESILAETAPFLSAPPLREQERERYAQFAPSRDTASLHDHCLRAIERASTRGRHGLPLIGTCDWNDGMDRLGARGEGESVWLGWFLVATLRQFAPLCEARGRGQDAARLRARAELVLSAIEDSGWDGEWYCRAFDDDGRAVGSASSDECRIDAISQAWAVMSRAARTQRARQAMEAVWSRLVRQDDGLALLLAPPFDHRDPSPGYIQGYPPGVRENGGQYSHAATWMAWAFAELGDGERAYRILQMITPTLRTRDPESSRCYRLEPYACAADVYGAEPHTGRGGWSWYTGTAAWVYRLGLEKILGLVLRGGSLSIDPCLPEGWGGYEARLRIGGATYRVIVDAPGGASHGVSGLWVDGAPRAVAPVRLDDDGQDHVIRALLGERRATSTGVSGTSLRGEVM